MGGFLVSNPWQSPRAISGCEITKYLEGGRPSSPLQASLVYEYMSKGWGGAKPNPAHKATKKYRKVALPHF